MWAKRYVGLRVSLLTMTFSLVTTFFHCLGMQSDVAPQRWNAFGMVVQPWSKF